jgi:hypothetical protein
MESRDLLDNLEFERETRMQDRRRVEVLEEQIEKMMQK